MDPAHRVVKTFPLEELFTKAGPLKARRLRDVGVSNLRESLGLRPLLVIADVGQPPFWVPREDTFDVWKKLLRTRIVEPGARFRLEDFPDDHCFFASEWALDDGSSVHV
jgi:hypothetical protein